MIVATELTKKEYQYLETQMKKVSRSFALVVSYFEEPYAWKNRRFEEFSILMNDPTAAIEILPFWGREPWPGLTKEVSRGVSYVSDEWLEAANYLSLNLNGATSDWKRMVLSNVFDEFRKATKYVLA